MNARAISASVGFVLSMIASAPAFAAAACPPEAYYSVRMQVAPAGHWAVPVTIMGKRKFFAIHTAAITGSVSEEIVNEFGLTRGTTNYTLFDSGGREFRPSLVRVPELRIGALRGDSLPFIVRNDGGDGTLAPDILNNYDIELDYSARIFNILKPKKCREAVVHWANDKIVAVPLRTAKVSGHSFVPVRIDGVKFDAMLSLASVDSWINADLARARLKVDFANPNLKEVSELQGPSFSKKIYERKFRSIEFEDMAVQEPLMQLMPDMIDRKISNQPYVGGLIERQEEERLQDAMLGMSVLQYFHIYIANSEHRMYLTKSAAAPAQ